MPNPAPPEKIYEFVKYFRPTGNRLCRAARPATAGRPVPGGQEFVIVPVVLRRNMAVGGSAPGDRLDQPRQPQRLGADDAGEAGGGPLRRAAPRPGSRPRRGSRSAACGGRGRPGPAAARRGRGAGRPRRGDPRRPPRTRPPPAGPRRGARRRRRSPPAQASAPVMGTASRTHGAIAVDAPFRISGARLADGGPPVSRACRSRRSAARRRGRPPPPARRVGGIDGEPRVRLAQRQHAREV